MSGSGTAFGIYFPFSQGYKYKIEIEANQIYQGGNSVIRVTTNSSRTHIPTGCNPEFVQYILNGANLSEVITTLTNSYATYTVAENYIPSEANINYLLFGSFQVAPASGNGYNQIRKVIITATNNCTLPAPSNLNSSYTSNSSAIVNWNSVFKAKSYTVEYKSTSSSTWVTLPPYNPPTTSYSIQNLLSGTTYDWRVKANCTFSEGTNYGNSQFTTSSCNLVTGLAASNITSNSATISWNNISGALSYNVIARRQTTNEIIYQNPNASFTSFNLNNLSSLQNYYVQVFTNCSSGVGDASEVLFQTLGSCPSHSNPTSSSITSNSAILSWSQAPPPALNTSKLEYKISNSNIWILVDNGISNNPHTLTGLAPNTQYDWRVTSICWGGGNGVSIQGQFTTLPSGLIAFNNDIIMNNKSSNSQVKNLQYKPNNISEFSIMPSVVNNIVSINFDLKESGETIIQLVNSVGKILVSKEIKSSNRISLNVGTYPNGVYYVRKINRAKTEVSKILIQH